MRRNPGWRQTDVFLNRLSRVLVMHLAVQFQFQTLRRTPRFICNALIICPSYVLPDHLSRCSMNITLPVIIMTYSGT